MSTTPVSSTTGTSTTGTTTNPSMNLSSSDFINMMLTQLQNQDPLNPTDSQALLQQMSSIGQLQSADQMQNTLTQFAFQNQMASAGGLIGKTVTGLDTNSASTSGIVTGVAAVNNQVYLNIVNASGADQIPMNNIQSVTNTGTTTTSAVNTVAATTTPAATTTTPQSTAASVLQGILGVL